MRDQNIPGETSPGLLLTISLSCPANLDGEVVAQMASLLEDEAISTSWEKTKTDWGLLWLVDFRPQTGPLAKKLAMLAGIPITAKDLRVAPVAEVNWLEQSYQQFPPFRIKKFYVHGSHYTGDIPAGLIPLQIDAATAFGSGEHGTTRGCLEALCRLQDAGFKPRSILDMGTGSGILAIAACKLWNKPALAIDNDREATRVACRHRRMNGIASSQLVCATGDGYNARRVRNGGPFDLIIANILAQPLIDMAPALEEKLSKKGRVVLSGLLKTQAPPVLKAHKTIGLKKLHAIGHDEWATLILDRGRSVST